MAVSSTLTQHGTASTRSIGVLTRTIIKSPEVHWLLNARLRHQKSYDVVFVGDDYIHVKQFSRRGHLEHVATKDDFDARIRAAKVFTNDADSVDEVFRVTAEDGDGKSRPLPPDMLVLTLTTNDLVFLFLQSNMDRTFRFVQQSCPMPTFDRTLYQPGHHLAIESRSRALAVAASEREVIIYSARSPEKLKHELRTGDENWCPVSAQRPLQVEGVIQHVDFLVPPDDDNDHIILLLIVLDQRMTKAVWIDWYYTSDLHYAQIHPGIPLSGAKTVPSLLIPLRNASFMMVTVSEARKYKDILSSSVNGLLLPPLKAASPHYGNSSMQPIWASWCRPRRSGSAMRDKDYIYLVREDGAVVLLWIWTNDTMSSSAAGHFRCHVGTAFASLGDTSDPDILAVAGDMSTGQVVTIGHWPSIRGWVSDLDWKETMRMESTDTIHNWASATDMVISALPQTHARSTHSRDGIFVTSGRQPYGTITELRQGREARLLVYFELDELNVVTAMWALPVASTLRVLILLSTPATTRFLVMTEDFRETAELDASQVSALDADHRTVAAAVTTDGQILQVTEKSICLTAGLIANFEDSVRTTYGVEDVIVAAAMEETRSMLVTAETRGSEHLLRCVSLLQFDTSASEQGVAALGHTVGLPSAPLAVTVTRLEDTTLVLASTANDGLCEYIADAEGRLQPCRDGLPPNVRNDASICDHLVLLRHEDCSQVLAACGMRDGRLLTIALSLDNKGVPKAVSHHTITFGQSVVRLVSMPNGQSRVCAMSGADICLIVWDGQNAQSLEIRNIWLSDKVRPELAQGALAASCQLPAADFLADKGMAGALAMISGNEFLVANVDRTPTTVPRQISVTGTPNRLLYSEQQRCLVVSSLQTAIRSFPTPHSRPEERRQIWPTIDFVPSRRSETSFTYDLQPGERVYALLEWCYQNEEKVYSFILVGGSYIRRNGSQGGRVRFLQPSRTGRDITGAVEGITTKFEAPVYALALFDELSYVVCYGDFVCLYHFVPVARKWQERCVPMRLASKGVYLTVEAPLIYVSTADDSLVTLRLDLDNPDEGKTLPRLQMVKSGPGAAQGLSHVIIRGAKKDTERDEDVALLSTKGGRIVGLASPSPDDEVPDLKAAYVLFEAQLPRSLTRIRQGNVRPQWKVGAIEGILVDNLVGIAADGTLVGVALLDNRLWRRLSWLQRLCEWNEELSPQVFQAPVYAADKSVYARYERSLPIGFSGGGQSEVMLRTSAREYCDNHIDGDILSRLLTAGGTEILRMLIHKAAERDDQVGAWMRDHLNEELQAVDEIMKLLRKVLDSWL